MYVIYIVICERYKAEYSTVVKFSVFALATFSVVPWGSTGNEMGKKWEQCSVSVAI